MRAHVAQYLNEVVSLAVLALMGLAVVSGQAASETLADAPVLVTEQFAEQLVEQVGTHLDLKVEISFRHEGE